ncbi:tRNA glutamyl-Q(34) synthetase GluQRS [Sphingomonas donggukensis]|uniref:tRNA glutamyl-Q(34) synthetase GluQRS n=1 Tax=Sphingomonas donggukensis TaxID=2949093 RepID=A0ABY4TRD4_9SPHN|nr:tRNA glutamyl-Q(34) synthetase GluQRS [Sphingomonas donggukensis]URW74957.1 tRNA glutamyl-Q(34) synthetase GluQRS [Sphingomonas donggukensis]
MSSDPPVVTRFAPSPTGRLHLGHAFSAIQAHDFARDRGGRFLLRIEDIDGTRSREEHVAGIAEDLAWLGLAWDGPVVRQSQRLALYDAALDRLRDMGLLYRCACTRADIAASLSAPHGAGGALYPGTCRGRDVDPALPHCWRLDVERALNMLPGAERGTSDAGGGGGPQSPRSRPAPSVRLRRPRPRAGEDLGWHDAFAGPQLADPLSHGDVVLARKDAPASYHLAVTVDDAAQGVTHVVRGVDLFESTHVHRLLQTLLGLPTPEYRHHPLLTDPDGKRLAKRDGAPSLADLRAQGMDGADLAAMLRDGRLPPSDGWQSQPLGTGIGFGAAKA